MLSSDSLSAQKISSSVGLTFDDILLIPGYTDFLREEVSLSMQLHSTIQLQLPVISAPMDTVSEEKMAIAIAQSGGIGVLHRNLEVEKQATMVHAVKEESIHDRHSTLDTRGRLQVGAAVGVGADLEMRLDALIQAEVDMIVVDSGHGYSKGIMDAVKLIKKKSDVPVMAGNIATAEAAKALIDSGANILRVGMGPGSICTTRIVTGMGVPQVSAIFEALAGASGANVTVVADGGIRQMGDIAKALGCGAHAVMLGSMLAGFSESPGETVTINGEEFKQYRGMGSIGAMKKGSAARYGQKQEASNNRLVPEGVEGLVPYKGSVVDFLYQVQGSLRSSLYYIGARNLESFRQKATFVRITPAGLRESHPHSITISDAGSNYQI